MGETAAAVVAPHFLGHRDGDQVAVAVQDVGPGAAMVVFLDSDREASLEVSDDIPLGHKVALVDIPDGADVIEYGVRIGLAREPIPCGSLVHTHNLRSARWETSR